MVSHSPYRLARVQITPPRSLSGEELQPNGSQALRTMERGWEAFLVAFPALAKLSVRKPVGLHP